ncbi:MAG: metallophosphoesterase family protein [Deltaproteobacteria bacterium]|nr:metallophosphoesterase family protein [Deltaproteobacteria bacterium]
MRYLVISDIHSNLAAFEVVLSDAGQFDMVWCLGDVIGYGPQPNECIERLVSLPHMCVAGNHDFAAVGKLDISAFNPDASRACLWTRNQLTPANREFIQGLPERFVKDSFTVVHGSPRHPIWEYVSHRTVAIQNFSHFDTAHCLVGHTHVPVIHRESLPIAFFDSFTLPANGVVPVGEDRLMINPGGVGQPRDGDPRASYAILDTGNMTIQQKRVEYPLKETQALMGALGLPPRLAERLSLGW